MTPVIGFAGMTHLGINSLAAAAARGFSSVGYHHDVELVEGLTHKILPIVEPGLAELFEDHGDRMTFGADPSILKDCDLVYISADVSTDDRGQSDLALIKALIRTVIPQLKPESILVVLCQVPPGFTRQLPFPPERLYYQVETLIFGRAVERAMYPERFIVGCPFTDNPLPVALQQFLAAFECPIIPMRYESAELAKISINMCLVASISVANVMADLCERIGADWSEIVPALKLDRRIGEYAYLKPGLGIAGGNIERDLTTVVDLADQTAGNADVVRAWIADSVYRKNWVLRKLRETVLKADCKSAIAVLGLAYKENTSSIKNSASIVLLGDLTTQEQRHEITVFDPQVRLCDTPITAVAEAKEALAACRGAQVILVMTPWPEFKSLIPVEIEAIMDDGGEGKFLIDPYRMFEPADCLAAGLRYLALGYSAS
jgi:UDPglucose 6-dehydrogenase